jgi:hypothetical protein
MADNLGYTPGSGALVATREVAYSGDTANVQAVGLVTVSGPNDANVATDVSPDNPLPALIDRTDNLLAMLSRVVKLLESNAVVDQQQRQRITLDSITSGITLATVTNVGAVTTVTTVANQTAVAGMDREMYINTAKQTYALSIRSRLEFI